MSEQPNASDALQFEKAEFEHPSAEAACAACNAPLEEYFELNGKTFCPGCKAQIEAARDQGTKASRALRALAMGTGVAVVGSIAYYAIRALTGYEFGLIAIGVGWGVGYAVNRGSYGRGGARYQALAIFLTYTSICFNYVPDIFEALSRPPPAAATSAASAVQPVAAGLDAPSVETAAQSPSASNETAPAEAPEPPSLVGLLVFAAFVTGLAYAAPFLGGFENIIGILIICFGLWEAWKANRRIPLVFSGPFKVAAQPAPASESAVA